MSVTEEFVQDFSILDKAAVGVVLIHTREPRRTEVVLHEFSILSEMPFMAWDAVNGWKVFNKGSEEDHETEAIKEPYAAMRRIDDLDNEDKKNAWTHGVFVMHGVHWVLPKHPLLVQLLQQYVDDFSRTHQRLVLLVPEGFSLPQELQNDVQILDFPLPSEGEIAESLKLIIEDSLSGSKEEVFDDREKALLARNAAGMTQVEVESSYAKAIATNADTWPATEFAPFNATVMKSKTEVIKRSEVLELMKPVNFDTVGGLDLLKGYIIQRKRAFTDEARAFGVDQPKGIMLVGPSGTGKSLCAKAIASALQIPLIKFDIGKVFGSLVGQSEEQVRSALKQLEACGNIVCLLDEVDKGLGGAHQAGGDSGVSKRVLGTILTHMQESTAPVYWVFSANRVDGLPPELLRKGRLDEVFCVTVPNIVERREILNIHLRKRKQDPANIKMVERAAEFSKGYSGSEIEAAVAEGVNMAFHAGRKQVETADIITQLQIMKPLSVAFKEDFDKMSSWASNNARASSTSCEDKQDTEAVSTAPTPRKRRLGGN